MTSKRLPIMLMAAAYPLVSHLGVALDVPVMGLVWLALVFLASFVLAPRSVVRLVLATFCLGGAGMAYFHGGAAELLVRLPPIVIALGLAWAFGRTLLPGRIALICQIGEGIRGELPRPVARYGYRLTLVWTVVLTLLAIECLLLGLLASQQWWSLFVNIVNYCLIAMLIVLEYPIRRLVLRDLEPTTFAVSLKRSLSAGLH